MKKVYLKEWLFINNENSDAWKKDFDDSSWKKIKVPHDWSVEQSFEKRFSSGTGYLPGGIGWYRTKLSIKKLGDLNNKIIKIHFDGIYKNARVWINGYHMGLRPSGYASFYYDLTDILSYAQDDDLIISVRVERTELADSRWYNGNGINRNVSIEIHDSIYIEDYGTIFSTPHVDKQEAQIIIEHQISNSFNENKMVTIIQHLESLQENNVFTIEKTVKFLPGESKKVKLSRIIKDPELWSPTNPNLYCLRTKLYFTDSSSKTIESDYTDYVGIRTFSFDANNGFYLNNNPEKIKGVCLHEDAGSFGTAVPVSVWTRRLLKLKKMGANAIRMAHNPHSFELYRLCDVLGFLVFDEAFDEWENTKNKWWQGHNVYPPKLHGSAEHFTSWHEEDLKNMVVRNRNHPSIIAWSIGNEIDYPNDPYANPIFSEMTGNNDNSKPAAERIYNPHRPDMRRLSSIANKLIKIIKENDNTRPVTIAAAFPELSTKLGLIDNIDLVGYNYKEHLYEEDHLKYPNKAFIGSENGHGFQEWKIVKDSSYISGQFLWTGVDYLGEAHGWPIHGSGAGLLTLAGFEKDSYYKRKSWWSSEPMVYLTTLPYIKNNKNLEWETTYRKWDYMPNQAVEIRCYTNASQIQLKIGEEIVSSLSYNEKYGYYSAIVQYMGNTLSVEAIFKNTILFDQISPTYAPAALRIKTADIPKNWIHKIESVDLGLERNLFQIECQVIDQEGKPTLSEIPIYVKVENGTLISLENGDLADNTSYSESFRRTFQGKLICFVESNLGKKPHVIMRSPGLPDSEIVLENE